MAPPAIPGSRSLLRESVGFMRKHPVLLPVAAWLIAVPSAVLFLFLRLLDAAVLPRLLLLPRTPAFFIVVLALGLLIVLPLWFLSWGTAAVLLTARRRIQSRSGRSRSSFRAVRTAALPLATALFLTQALRWCGILALALAGLAMGLLPVLTLFPDCPPLTTPAACHVSLVALPPFLLPALWYGIATAFVGPIVADEGLTARSALRRSRQVTHRHVLRALGRILGLLLLLELPVLLLGLAADRTGVPGALTDIVTAGLSGFTWTAGTIANASLYGALRDAVILPKSLRLDGAPTPAPASAPLSVRPQEVVAPAPEAA